MMPLGLSCAPRERVKMSFCLTYCTSRWPSFTVPRSLAFHRRVSECRLTSSQRAVRILPLTNRTVNWKGVVESVRWGWHEGGVWPGSAGWNGLCCVCVFGREHKDKSCCNGLIPWPVLWVKGQKLVVGSQKRLARPFTHTHSRWLTCTHGTTKQTGDVKPRFPKAL